MLNKFTQMKDPAEQKAIMDAPAQGGGGHAVFPGLQQSHLLPVQHQALHRLGDADNPFVTGRITRNNPGRLLQLLALRPVNS